MISAGSGFAPAAGGMTTYYEGLLPALAAREEVDGVVALTPPWETGLKVPAHPKVEAVACRGLPAGRIGRVAYEHVAFPRAVRGAGVQVLLSTHNVKPAGWRGPSVVVLQSMQYFFLPDPIGRLRKAYLKLAVPRSLRAADVAIAVSETQRLHALELFGLEPDEMVTVHHGASPWALEAARRLAREGLPPRPADIRRPYVATVSSLYGMKNHRRLIEAFSRTLAETGADHELVIAGREVDVTVAELQRLSQDLGIAERVRLTGPFPQADLPGLLAHADAIAYVSLYETFGHPVLEAFAFDRPLVTSTGSGSAEVAGDAARLVDPYNVESIAEGITEVLTRPDIAARLADAGKRRLRDFSWEASAAGTVEALRMAIQRHGGSSGK
jgi:glycosyltransferase involved in cell wall biosynthesis